MNFCWLVLVVVEVLVMHLAGRLMMVLLLKILFGSRRVDFIGVTAASAIQAIPNRIATEIH